MRRRSGGAAVRRGPGCRPDRGSGGRPRSVAGEPAGDPCPGAPSKCSESCPWKNQPSSSVRAVSSRDPVKSAVVPVAVSGQSHSQLVMQVVGPDPVETPPSTRLRLDQARPGCGCPRRSGAVAGAPPPPRTRPGSRPPRGAETRRPASGRHRNAARRSDTPGSSRGRSRPGTLEPGRAPFAVQVEGRAPGRAVPTGEVPVAELHQVGSRPVPRGCRPRRAAPPAPGRGPGPPAGAGPPDEP